MNKMKKGFTLVELSISLVFVAILLIAVATISISIGKTYQKGLTLKTINQVGRDVVDQMRRDARSAQESEVAFEHSGTIGVNQQFSFRLCLGDVTYVGNGAKALQDNSSLLIKAGGNPIKLARIQVAGTEYCQRSGSSFVLADIRSSDTYQELLAEANPPLAVHNMAFSRYVKDPGGTQSIYNLVVSLGSNENDTIGSSGECLPPSNENSNFDYCAVSEFTSMIKVGDEEQ